MLARRGNTHLEELSQELPAHSAGTTARDGVSSHGDRFEAASLEALNHGSAHRNTLGAGADRVGSVFNIGPNNVFATLGEQSCSDVEKRVRAYAVLSLASSILFSYDNNMDALAQMATRTYNMQTIWLQCTLLREF